jgi:hypothetical protein
LLRYQGILIFKGNLNHMTNSVIQNLNITRDFGVIKAVDNPSLAVEAGEIGLLITT